ncbi:unnamed protein product, partial [Medioppia subpectinata]
ERDVAKLYDLGFDLRVDPSGQIGETGQVFVGVYTAQITDTQRTDQGKYLRDVRPGQPFAAKYAQLATDTEPYDYLCHVVEKAVMKALSHPNIMAYRVVINLGQRAILRNVSGSEAPDHAGYRRVFLIMDYADHGTLFRFAQKGKLYDRLAVQFTGELCSAIDYMHAKGVAHNDLHHKNILVFNAQGGEYTIKLTDFGMSISSAIYGELGVEVSAGDIQEMIENDLSELKGMLNFMIGKCSGNVLNEGIDLTQVSQLSNELSRTREPLLDVLKRYSTGLGLLPISSTNVTAPDITAPVSADRTEPIEYDEPTGERLEQLYVKAPAFYKTPALQTDPRVLSGEAYVSSAEEGEATVPMVMSEPDILLRKTKIVLGKLHEWGFNVNIDPESEIGSGTLGRVYRGSYTNQIKMFAQTRQGRYLRDSHIQPGDLFAAKYSQLMVKSDTYKYLSLVTERAVLKSLSHSNIISYRVAINLGQRVVLRNREG